MTQHWVGLLSNEIAVVSKLYACAGFWCFFAWRLFILEGEFSPVWRPHVVVIQSHWFWIIWVLTLSRISLTHFFFFFFFFFMVVIYLFIYCCYWAAILFTWTTHCLLGSLSLKYKNRVKKILSIYHSLWKTELAKQMLQLMDRIMLSNSHICRLKLS